VAAVRGGHDDASGALTEDDWTDLDHPGLSPYVRSKTIAERAGWDLVEERDAVGRLAVVNPGAILGPTLSEDHSFSLELVERLLNGVPGTPRIGFSIVDVRDVADLEIRAMLAPDGGGERFLAVTEFRWMAEVAAVLRDQLGEQAAKVPTRTLPNLAVRAMGLFDPGIRSIANQLGVRVELSSEKARRVLGWSPRPADETIVDTARSLLAAPSPTS
jgi:nucleoside-diphosphate-sugar epimerase